MVNNMQKKKNAKRKCNGLENPSECESLDNLNNPYGYDYCYNEKSAVLDNYNKIQHLFNYDYLDKR